MAESKVIACEKFEGWGYVDSFLFVNPKGSVEFAGKRYPVISGKVLPAVRTYMESLFHSDLRQQSSPSKALVEHIVPPLRENAEFNARLLRAGIKFSVNAADRLIRAHGQSASDMMRLRFGEFDRVPDVVVFPKCENDVVTLVRAADECGICIIPFGGGSNVTNALDCPLNEARPIVSMDMKEMNKLLWINSDNMTARFEAGIVGQELERQLKDKGFTLGHEPDSIEFSTLGGWVATNASGMKRHKYGNIEDLIVQVAMVTPRGILQRSAEVSRISSGPDLQRIILGSEGTLGVITEVTLRICEAPECQRFGSLAFANFELGVRFVREVAKQRCQLASIRLADNGQFNLGRELSPDVPLGVTLRFAYAIVCKRYRRDEMCVATLIFEGRKEDFAYNYSIVGESMETTVPWDRVLSVCSRVKKRFLEEANRHGVETFGSASCRITQLYDSGCCIYIYISYKINDRAKNPLQTFRDIEEACRAEIIAAGGSISHHHGVGKIRKAFMPTSIGDVGMATLRSIKRELDSNNVFAAGNLLPTEPSKL